ncbi:DsrE family protein [Lunatibacter salilacus]|uniref:DsrE family protein n=1 Tax=Lunatibacter salilacus TaxID=2483804 RepID=UPI00131BCBF7|nr:DsrE family protein [Lunatibacter salilacus]
MLKVAINKGAQLKICVSCAEARALRNSLLVEGTELSTKADMANWMVDIDKRLTF